MKRMGRLFLLFICILMPIYACAAAPVDSVTVDSTKHILTIQGTIPEDADKWVTMEILKENVVWTREEAAPGQQSLEDYDGSDSILNYLEYFGQIDVQSQRAYTITLKNYMRSEMPEMRLRLGEDSFYYFSPKVLSDINAVTTASALESAVMGNSYLNAQIQPEYALLEETQTDTFWELLFAHRNSLEGNKFTTFGDITSKAGEYARITRLKFAQDVDDLKAVITLCEEYGISQSNSYDLYLGEGDFDNSEMGEVQKANMLASILEKKDGYKTISGFVDDFLDQTVLYACSGNESKYYVNAILQNADRLNQDNMGKFSKLSNTEKLKVCNTINAQQPYASIDALERAVSSAAGGGSKNTGSGGGSNSGGGASGGFAGSVGLPTDIQGEHAPTTDAEGFTDLGEVAWAQEAIDYLRSKNIVSGRGEHLFDPMAQVSREEFAKMLVLAVGCYDSTATEVFDDVDASAWYCPYVASAQKAGLIKGISETQFGTGMAITREDMAVLLTRAAGGKVAEVIESGFADDEQMSGYAKGAVCYVRENGIMNGVGDGMFAPKEVVTRAQAAKAIYELMRRG